MTAFGGGGTPFTGGGGTAFGGGGVPFGGVGGIPGVRGGAKKPKRDLAALLQDIEDMVGGLINAPVALTKATAKTFGADVDSPDLGDIGGGIVESYKDMYGPAARGDWGEFLDKLREHPLQPILDVATIATLGAGGVGKLGQVAAKAGKGQTALTKFAGYVPQTPQSLAAAQKAGISQARIAETPGLVPKVRLRGEGFVAPGMELGQELPRNPLVRARKEAVRGALDVAGVGPLSTAARETRAFKREDRRREAQLFSTVRARAERDTGPLNRVERAAYQYALQGILPSEMAGGLRRQLDELDVNDPGRAPIETQLAEIEKHGDDIEALAADPTRSEKFAKAVDSGRQLADFQQQRAVAQGLLDPDTLLERAYGPIRALRGATTRRETRTRLRDPEAVSGLRSRFESAQKAAQGASERAARWEDDLAEARAAAERKMPDTEGWAAAVRDDPFGATTKGLIREHLHPKVASLVERLLNLADPTRGATPAEAANALNRAQQILSRQLDAAAQKARAQVEKELADIDARASGRRRDTEAEAAAAQKAAEQARRDLDKGELDVEEFDDEIFEGGPTLEELIAERREAGLADPVYFPHITARSLRGKGSTARQSQQILNRPGSRKIDEQRKSTMYNFINARYDRDPAAMFETSTRVLRMVDVGERFNKMLELSMTVPAHVASEQNMVILNPARIKNLRRKWDEASTFLGRAQDIMGDDPAFIDLRDQYLNGLKLADSDVPKGSVQAVPKELYQAMIGDLDRVGKVGRAFDNITDVWRAIVLPLRPAWIVNNAVGNYMLLALADNPITSMKNLGRAVALSKGERAGLETVRKFGKTDAYHEALLRGLSEALPDILSSGQVRRETGRVAAARGASTAGTPIARLRNAGNTAVRAGVKGVDTATEINAILTDDIPRLVLYLNRMDREVAKARRTPRYKDAPDSVIVDDLLADDAFAGRISQDIMRDMLDYGSLSPAERTYARRFIPFYAWNRLITQYTIRQLLDRPALLLGIQQASEIGLEGTERERGALPSYLRGAIPVGDEGVLTTRGFNPFETPATIAKTIGGLFGTGQSLYGPDTVGAQIGPIPGALIEGATGKELFGGPVRLPFSRTEETPEGQPVPILARPFTQFAGNLPIVGLAERGVEDLRGVERGESIYEPGFLQYLASYMGIPYRQLNQPAAQSRAFEERARANQPAQTVGLFG